MSVQGQSSAKSQIEWRHTVARLTPEANKLLDLCATMPHNEIETAILGGVADRLGWNRDKYVFCSSEIAY